MELDSTTTPADTADGRAVVILGMPTRLALLTSGAALIGLVIAVLVWNDLGPGPIDAFVVGVHTHTGLPISVSIWALFGLVNAIAWALGRRPGIGTLVAPIVAGFIIEFVLAALSAHGPADALVVRVGLQVGGIAVVGVGVGAMVASKLGAGPPELLAAALADRTGMPESMTRTGFEVSCLAGALLLGGPVGLGTLIVAALIGPAVVRGCRLVDATLAAASRRRPQYARRRDRDPVDVAPSTAGARTVDRAPEHPMYGQEPHHDDRRERPRCRDATVPRHQRRLPHHRTPGLLRRAHRPCVP